MADTPVTAEDEVKERVAYISPYEQWKKSEGLPTYRGLAIKNVNEVELAPWKSSGDGFAAFLNLEGTGGFNDSYIAEIPPRQVAQGPSPSVRGNDLYSKRPGRHFGVDRSQQERNLRVAGGQLFFDSDECLARASQRVGFGFSALHRHDQRAAGDRHFQ